MFSRDQAGSGHLPRVVALPAGCSSHRAASLEVGRVGARIARAARRLRLAPLSATAWSPSTRGGRASGVPATARAMTIQAATRGLTRGVVGFGASSGAPARRSRTLTANPVKEQAARQPRRSADPGGAMSGRLGGGPSPCCLSRRRWRAGPSSSSLKARGVAGVRLGCPPGAARRDPAYWAVARQRLHHVLPQRHARPCWSRAARSRRTVVYG